MVAGNRLAGERFYFCLDCLISHILFGWLGLLAFAQLTTQYGKRLPHASIISIPTILFRHSAFDQCLRAFKEISEEKIEHQNHALAGFAPRGHLMDVLRGTGENVGKQA